METLSILILFMLGYALGRCDSNDDTPTDKETF